MDPIDQVVGTLEFADGFHVRVNDQALKIIHVGFPGKPVTCTRRKPCPLKRGVQISMPSPLNVYTSVQRAERLSAVLSSPSCFQAVGAESDGPPFRAARWRLHPHRAVEILPHVHNVNSRRRVRDANGMNRLGHPHGLHHLRLQHCRRERPPTAPRAIDIVKPGRSQPGISSRAS